MAQQIDPATWLNSIMSMKAADPNGPGVLQSPISMQSPGALQSTPPQPPAPVPQQVPSVPLLSKGSFSKKTGKEDETTKENTYDQAGDALNLLRSQPEYKQAQKGNQDLSDYISRLTKVQNPDSPNWLVGPLAALSDSMTGSKLSAQAAAQNPSSQAQQLLKYKDELNKRQNDTVKTLLESVSKLKTGQTGQTSTNINLSGVGGPGMNSNNDAKNLAQWQDRLNKDPGIKTANDIMDSVDRVKNALAVNNSASTYPVIAGILRGAGINRLTQAEISTVGGGDTSWAAKLEQAMQKAEKGGFTEQNKQEFTDAIGALAKGAPNLYKNKQNEYTTLASGMGIDPKYSQPIMQSNLYRAQPQTASPSGRTKELKDMTQAELDAYEQSLHGGK